MVVIIFFLLYRNTQSEIFDFHSEYDNVSVSEFPKNWLPIDVNFILPSFDAAKRMPGMFTPKRTYNKGIRRKAKQMTQKSNDK